MCFIQLSFCFQEEDWSDSVTQKWLEAEVSLYNLISFQAVYKKYFLTLIRIEYHYQFESAQIQYMKDVTLMLLFGILAIINEVKHWCA